MKIYTRTGDDGETGLFAGPRVGKDDVRIEAYGTVDELNTLLGLARAEGLPQAIDESLSPVQDDLFVIGAELATPDPSRGKSARIGPRQVAALEASIDEYEQSLEPLRQFILPGGSPAAARLHVARAVCRRAERRVVTLVRGAVAADAPHVVCYLNRLSDLLFVLARVANVAAGHPEVTWTPPPQDD